MWSTLWHFIELGGKLLSIYWFADTIEWAQWAIRTMWKGRKILDEHGVDQFAEYIKQEKRLRES